MFGREGIGQHDGPSFTRLVERLLWHLGFENVTNIDGSGDGGADLVADFSGQHWVFQCKWKQSAHVGESAVDEVLSALQKFGADRAAVVTNSEFASTAVNKAQTVERLTGMKVGLWSGEDLENLWSDSLNCSLFLEQPQLRPYQADAFAAVQYDLSEKSRALLILATGLGKTVIAGNAIQRHMKTNPESTVLVVAHARDLVDQLQRSMWRHVSKYVPVQQLTGDEKPDRLNGVTCGTIQSVINLARLGWRPDFIFIDEAHHVGENGLYSELIDLCSSSKILGVTATPWRGDSSDIIEIFGGASFKLGIEEGMRLGYLCDVRYRVFVDDVDWDLVRTISHNRYSIRELNSSLFIPQRDERIRDELLTVWNQTRNPRAIVFCQTIEHARRMQSMLSAVPQWRNAQSVHNEVRKRERQIHLMNFRRGVIPLLIAVDVLNEGVDIPDVNIVCFARVTHSRRIFVQQVGRGLRLSSGKEHVTVIDFVSDLRRVAEVLHLRRAIVQDLEDVFLPSSHSITFEDKRVESLMSEWLLDVADIELDAENARFDFPDFLG